MTSRRILVIDDTSDSASALRRVLELSGHVVQVAHDGESGIEMARQSPPDVVLCDIGLPGQLDGYAVALALRSDNRCRNVVLIAVTGFGRPEDEQRARQAGFDQHLTKPVDAISLARMIADREMNGLVERT